MKKAGLIDSPKRGVLRISNKGLEVLQSKPDRINVKFLQKFPEFVEFQTLKRDENEAIAVTDNDIEQTPEESLDISYQKLERLLP